MTSNPCRVLDIIRSAHTIGVVVIDTPQYRMADRLCDGNLAKIILDYRRAGKSYEQISRQLYADFGIEVTRQTCAAWGKVIAEEAAA